LINFGALWLLLLVSYFYAYFGLREKYFSNLFKGGQNA
jgi:hypothetical protein